VGEGQEEGYLEGEESEKLGDGAGRSLGTRVGFNRWRKDDMQKILVSLSEIAEQKRWGVRGTLHRPF